MKTLLRPALVLFVALTVVTGVVYPAVVTALSQAVFPHQANGSLIDRGGKAVGSYLGKVEVARGAQKTDAEQSVKAMLLDRGATANCKPELEIFADDVKCAHGASVGELDAMQLFYAESRGLDPATARALLLEGFVMGLWESAKDPEPIAEAAREALRRVV